MGEEKGGGGVSKEAVDRLMRLRSLMISALRADAEFWGDAGKGHDGSFSLVMPGAWQSEWGVKLDCYAIGPSRHYDWWGATLLEAVTRAERDVQGWIAEAATNRIQEIHERAL